METIKLGGAQLTPKLFIELYGKARKLSPPRFMTLRLSPERYKQLYEFADIPESIQVGPTAGPLGKTIIRIHCIKPPLGVADGIAIKEDPECDMSKMYFEIHGQPELVVEEIG